MRLLPFSKRDEPLFAAVLAGTVALAAFDAFMYGRVLGVWPWLGWLLGPHKVDGMSAVAVWPFAVVAAIGVAIA